MPDKQDVEVIIRQAEVGDARAILRSEEHNV